VPAAVGRVTHVLALGLAIPVSDWPASSSSARIMLRADSRGHPECDSEIPSPVSRFEVTGNRAYHSISEMPRAPITVLPA
jgi:hypothetical protein